MEYMKRYGLGVLFFLLLNLFSTVHANNNELPTPVGRVVWVKGTFKAAMPNKELRILQKTSLIFLHDKLITEANSEAEIVFTDNSLMTFRPQTTFTIDEYAYSQNANSTGAYVMSLIEGGLRTITGLVAKFHPDQYRIKTPVATVGVRGTDFTIYYQGGKLWIARMKGVPCLKNKKGQICLNEEVRFAYVPGVDAPPVPLSDKPEEINDLLITPAVIAPFTPPGNGGGGGVVSSFCIQTQ